MRLFVIISQCEGSHSHIGTIVSLSVCLDDQFGVWDDQGSNRKTSNKSPTTSSEMRVAGNASSSYKDRRADWAGPGLNIRENQICRDLN